MNSKNYIIDKLKEIHSKICTVSFRYQYDTNSNMHIVEVHPLFDYKENKEYIDLETKLSFEFENEFFPESILFVSDESLTKVTHPIFIISAKESSVIANNKILNYSDLINSFSKPNYKIFSKKYFDILQHKLAYIFEEKEDSHYGNTLNIDLNSDYYVPLNLVKNKNKIKYY